MHFNNYIDIHLKFTPVKTLPNAVFPLKKKKKNANRNKFFKKREKQTNHSSPNYGNQIKIIN